MQNQSATDKKQPTITLNAFRYSLVSSSKQGDLFIKEPPQRKGMAIVPFLDNRLGDEFYHHNTHFLLLSTRRYHTEHGSWCYVGKLAKKAKAQIGGLDDTNGIIIQELDNWIPIWVVIDVYNQYILTENNRDFGEASHVGKVIQAMLSGFTKQTYNYRTIVDPVIEKNAFWDIIENAEKIYSVNLKLISPNIFGAHAQTKKMLNEVRAWANQQELGIYLSNKSGNLKIEKGQLSGALEYIEEGEGNWSARVRGPGQEKPQTHKSENHAVKVTAEVQPASDGDIHTSGERADDYAEAALVSSIAALVRNRNG